MVRMMAEYSDILESEIIRDGEPTGTFVKGYRVYSVVEDGWVVPYIEFNLPHDVPLSFSLREFDVWMDRDHRRVAVFLMDD